MRPIALACLLLLPATAFAGNPWEELMGKEKPRLWTDPAGRFSIDLPVNWKANASDEGGVVRFIKRHPDYGQTAVVYVEVHPLPPNVRLSHFALKIERETVKMAPNYRKVSERRTTIAGVKGRRTHFTYQEQRNAQLGNEGDQVLLITGERGWVIRMLTAVNARNLFLEDFNKMVNGFSAMAAGDIAPIGGKGRKKRKRLRAGEMVNPDMIKY